MTILTTAAQALQQDPIGTNAVHLVGTAFIYIKLLIAVFGAIAILWGAVLAGYRYVCYRFGSPHYTTHAIRLELASSIILGLEFFVGSDVIETTIAPDFSSLGILGLLVLIRTFLNYTLQREVKNLSLDGNAQAQG